MNLYDFETKFQEFETKLKETVDEEGYAEAGLESPARFATRIYSKLCRPQMYFGIDTLAEYEGVIAMMGEFIKKYPEFPEMMSYQAEFDQFVSKEYRNK